MAAKLSLILATVILTGIAVQANAEDNAGETSADVLAARVRDQGFLCEGVSRVAREKSEAVSDDAVWILTCENRAYRMVLVPDMADRIEPMRTRRPPATSAFSSKVDIGPHQ